MPWGDVGSLVYFAAVVAVVFVRRGRRAEQPRRLIALRWSATWAQIAGNVGTADGGGASPLMLGGCAWLQRRSRVRPATTPAATGDAGRRRLRGDAAATGDRRRDDGAHDEAAGGRRRQRWQSRARHQGYDASVDYVANALRDKGFDVQTPEFEVRMPYADEPAADRRRGEHRRQTTVVHDRHPARRRFRAAGTRPRRGLTGLHGVGLRRPAGGRCRRAGGPRPVSVRREAGRGRGARSGGVDRRQQRGRRRDGRHARRRDRRQDPGHQRHQGHGRAAAGRPGRHHHQTPRRGAHRTHAQRHRPNQDRLHVQRGDGRRAPRQRGGGAGHQRQRLRRGGGAGNCAAAGQLAASQQRGAVRVLGRRGTRAVGLHTTTSNRSTSKRSRILRCT